MSHIRVSSKKQLAPLIPKGKADVVIGLEPVEALRVLTQYGNPETVAFVNTRPIYPLNVTSGDEPYPEEEDIQESLAKLSRKVYYIPATEMAMEMGSAILGNMIMIGAFLAAQLLPLTLEEFRLTLERNFSAARLANNLQALEEGRKKLSPSPAEETVSQS